MLAQTLGGIGLFLVGMVMITDGLRAAAGDSLRRALLRFTGGPVKALFTGAAVTAVVQSSSATTVATIGFIGAGLLTFEQALGLIFGANIGTTATGWFVALFGLKFGISTLALPLVGVGALIRLFTRGRAAHLGVALSGFGIIFIGIDTLQLGMAGLSDQLTPAELPSDTWPGRLLLVGLGLLLTTVMQSSSAAITTALAALHGGAISLHQAAALVIGINIGTTVTAGLAALGGSTAAKRTAFAHLLFNLLTGMVAFACLPIFVLGISKFGERVAPGDAALLLAAFHTVFNVVGVVLILPFTKRFAAMVTRVVRHRGPQLTRLLDSSAAQQGALGTEAVRQTTIEILRAVTEPLEPVALGKKLRADQLESLDVAAAALQEAEEYVSTLRFSFPLSEEGHKRHLSTIHAMDHIRQLIDLAMSPLSDLETDDYGDVASHICEALQSVRHWADDPKRPAPVDSVRHLHEDLSASVRAERNQLLADTASGSMSPRAAGARLAYLRWQEEVAYHLWRLVDRLRGERMLDVPDSLAKDPLPSKSA